MNRKTDFILGASLVAICTILLVWLAIFIAPIFDPKSLSNTINNFEQAKLSPLKLSWCSNTPKFILAFLLIEAFSGLYLYTAKGKTRAGAEHGGASLKSPRMIGKYLMDKDFFNNRILSENVRLSITGRKAPIPALNTLAIGGMGSGKSFFVVFSNLLQGKTSNVVTDPSRQLIKATGWFQHNVAKANVIAFDLIDPTISAKYNFFEYIHDELDIERVVQMLFKSTVEKERRDKSNTDPMWDLMAQDMLYSYIALIWLKGLKSEQNISSIVYLMEEDFLKEDPQTGVRISTPVMEMFDALDREIPDNIATRKYRSATEGAVVTIRGVKSTLRGRIGKFLLPSIQALMSRDELHLERIGKELTSLYLCVPNEDHSFNFIVSLLYSQLFNELYRQAKANKGEHLDIPVQFFMDEMANFAVPDEFVNYLTTGRKHWMSYMMLFQEIGQINNMFDKLTSTVIGTCNTVIYLGYSGKDTNKFFSEWIGNETIDTKSYTRNYGRNGGSSSNTSKTKREVYTPDEIDTLIPEDECLIYTSGKGFCQDKKYKPKTHPHFKYSAYAEGGIEYDYSGSEIISATIKKAIRTVDKLKKPDVVFDFNHLDIDAYLEDKKFEYYEGE